MAYAIEEANFPSMELTTSSVREDRDKDEEDDQVLVQKVWMESKKLWSIVGPTIFSRIATFSMFIISQAFAGHLSDLDLAAISIASSVIVGFDYGLLVLSQSYNLIRLFKMK